MKTQIEVETESENFERQVNFKVDEIISNGQTNGRNRETIYNQTRRGFIAELGVVGLVGGSLNSTQLFNPSKPETFAYDIISDDGYKIEVKVLSEDNSHSGWLNVNMKSHKKSNLNYGVYPDVETACKYSDLIDYIVFVEVNKNIVKMKYIMDMKTFKNNLRESRNVLPKANSTHYLDPNKINLLSLKHAL